MSDEGDAMRDGRAQLSAGESLLLERIVKGKKQLEEANRQLNRTSERLIAAEKELTEKSRLASEHENAMALLKIRINELQAELAAREAHEERKRKMDIDEADRQRKLAKLLLDEVDSPVVTADASTTTLDARSKMTSSVFVQTEHASIEKEKSNDEEATAEQNAIERLKSRVPMCHNIENLEEVAKDRLPSKAQDKPMYQAQTVRIASDTTIISTLNAFAEPPSIVDSEMILTSSTQNSSNVSCVCVLPEQNDMETLDGCNGKDKLPTGDADIIILDDKTGCDLMTETSSSTDLRKMRSSVCNAESARYIGRLSPRSTIAAEPHETPLFECDEDLSNFTELSSRTPTDVKFAFFEGSGVEVRFGEPGMFDQYMKLCRNHDDKHLYFIKQDKTVDIFLVGETSFKHTKTVTSCSPFDFDLVNVVFTTFCAFIETTRSASDGEVRQLYALLDGSSEYYRMTIAQDSRVEFCDRFFAIWTDYSVSVRTLDDEALSASECFTTSEAYDSSGKRVRVHRNGWALCERGLFFTCESRNQSSELFLYDTSSGKWTTIGRTNSGMLAADATGQQLLTVAKRRVAWYELTSDNVLTEYYRALIDVKDDRRRAFFSAQQWFIECTETLIYFYMGNDKTISADSVAITEDETCVVTSFDQDWYPWAVSKNGGSRLLLE